MKFALAIVVLAATMAAGSAYLRYAGSVEPSSAQPVEVAAATPAAGVTPAAAATPAAGAPLVIVGSPTPIPPSWPIGLHFGDAGVPMLIACFDANRDARLNATDGPEFAGLDITLVPEKECGESGRNADFYEGPRPDASSFSCGAAKAPMLIVPVPAAATNLLDTTHGESLGVMDIANALGQRAADAGAAAQVVVSTSAIDAALPAQTSMERFLASYLARRLDELPCLRVVIFGHSHGGTTVTSVGAALDGRYADRLLVVLIDRTTALYDRHAEEFPARALILNYYQLNEGWHGVPLEMPNAIDLDQSAEFAPIAPSAGGGGIEQVTHRSLDDSPAVQRRIVDAVMAWALGGG